MPLNETPASISKTAKITNSNTPNDVDTARFRALFDSIDLNKDGHLEISELALALKKSVSGDQTSNVEVVAQNIIESADSNRDEQLDFAEFVTYMQKHESDLKLTFADLDKNKDGIIEPEEIRAALLKLGLHVTLEEAIILTERIDKDNSVSLSWTEWRDFFQLYPSSNLSEMVVYWRSGLMIDIGDSLTVPPDFTEHERKTGKWWRHLVAGGMAGAISRSFTAPLDRLKIMLQVHGKKSDMTLTTGLGRMIKEGGYKSLWRGNGTNVIKIAPESALKFTAYEQIKKLFKGSSTTEISIVERFAAGSMAGALAQTTIYPLEVVKTRLAISKSGQYNGIMDCSNKIFQKEGLKAFYRGYLPNLIGIIPYAGIDLTIYETLKQYYMKQQKLSKHPKKEPGVLVLLACGTVSSTCGQLASYPLALVRTRLQANSEQKTGMVDIAKQILKQEGVRGMYRGIAPNFLKVLPAVSISYVIYEQSKTWLGI